MEQNNTQMLTGEQIIFSASRNPFEVLPGFIKGWAVTDTVFSGIWCAAALLWWTLAVCLLAFGYVWTDVVFVAAQGAAAALAGGVGLYANILLLSKKPRGVRAGKCLIVLTIWHILWHIGQAFLVARCGIQLQYGIVLAAFFVLATAGRITLLVFYWIAIARAARYFESRRQKMGF